MLLLQSPSLLTIEETWLRKAYLNIVTKLAEFAVNPSESFDPFSAKFMGLDSIELNKYEYRAFMEVTSYFWGSKGGRGALLEKVIAAAGGTTAANGMLLSQIPQWIGNIRNSKNVKEWKVTGSAPKLKFDLLNVIGSRLVFLEIKNRVDSGGTAAREEALAKKFLALCKAIQNEEKVYVGDGVEMDIAQAFLALGIKKVEMHTGFLFSVDGSEATLDSDKSKGFFGQSRKLLEDYYKAQNHRFSVKLTYDEAFQRLSFEKDGLVVVLDLLYGSDVTREYTPDRADLQSVLRKVFARRWDDVWLALNVAISERALLLQYANNHMIQIREMLT
ncbi:MAG: hypothetical protein MN733_06480, partial [Nitrososphaera sp.]|nr:hypothetical protein [Nitrososphaera sp.]